MKKIIIFISIVLALAMLLSVEELKIKTPVVNRLSASEFNLKMQHYIENGEDYDLIDIRTKPEFDQGHIKGARMLDFYSPGFIEELKKMDKNKPYLIYCRSGNRTGQALKIMQKLGFTNVSDLKAGIVSWLKSGFILD